MNDHMKAYLMGYQDGTRRNRIKSEPDVLHNLFRVQKPKDDDHEH
jgi:hypothetical protein